MTASKQQFQNTERSATRRAGAVGAHSGDTRHPRPSPGCVSLTWVGSLLADLPDFGILISSAPLAPQHSAWHAADMHLDFYVNKVISFDRAPATWPALF